MLTLWRDILPLIALFLVALGLRLVDLGHESIWLDEAFSVDTAQHSPGALWRGEPLDPGNPPGYYIVLHEWLRRFGSTVESARALSGVAGALVIVPTWWLARVSGCSPVVALLASLLVAVSPPMVFLGREARVYTLFMLMLTLSAAAAESIVVATRNRQARLPWFAWIAFTLSAATLNYLHYYSILALPVLGAYLAIRLLPMGIVPLVTLAGSFGLIGLAFAPWLPHFFEQIRLGTTRGGDTWLMHLLVTPLYSLAGHTLVWKQDGTELVALMIGLATVAIYLPVAYWLTRSGRWPVMPTVMAFGLVGMAVAISLAKSPMLQSRYLAVIDPCLMIILAAGLVEGYRQTRRLARVTTWSIAGLMVASLALVYTKTHKEDWRPLAGYVATEGSSLPVYCYEDVARLSFNYYVPWMRVTAIDPVREPFTPDGQSWREAGILERMESHADGCWFILYLSLGKTMPELSAIDQWLREHFTLAGEYGMKADEPTFPFLHAYHLQPKSGAVDVHAGNR